MGYAVAGRLLDLFYKVTVDHEPRRAAAEQTRSVVYLINHRSNADYVLVSYALAGKVALSYAVGEWARAFPLEHVFKVFGSYFVRRRYREPLYHAVLERYVQITASDGITQGIFLEGGLTRDGPLKPPKIGLLDYVLGIARDPSSRASTPHRARRGQLRPRARGSLATARAGVAEDAARPAGRAARRGLTVRRLE